MAIKEKLVNRRQQTWFPGEPVGTESTAATPSNALSLAMSHSKSVRRPPLRFATTHWSVVLRAGESDSEVSRQAIHQLFQTYWYPLYAFARRRGNSHHDALDLTQGFFTHLLSGQALGSVAEKYGRFRSFLIAAFKNFMANEYRATQAARRGGAIHIVSLTTTDFEARYEREPVDGETPERLFERRWVESLLHRVQQRLREEYERAGKMKLFQLLEPHLTYREEATPRAEIAQQLQLSTAAVAMSIHRMRRRFGELLREEIAATVDDPEEVDNEVRSLMTIVGRVS